MMDLARLRSDSPVVRGGVNRDPAKLLIELVECEADEGRAVLSVFIVETEALTWDEAVLEACVQGPVKNGQIQVATVQDLLRAEFFIADERTQDESEVHYHVYFPVPVTSSSAEAWLACFDGPMPNPAKNRRL